MLLLDPIIHLNILCQIMLKIIAILTPHQFIMTPLLDIQSVLHHHYMYQNLKTDRIFLQANMGKNILKHHQNRFVNQILKTHVRINGIYF